MTAKKVVEIERKWQCESCKSAGIVWITPLKGIEKCPACGVDRKHMHVTPVRIGGNFIDIWKRALINLPSTAWSDRE